MIRIHEEGIVRRNNSGRAKEVARKAGIWLLTMAAIITCLAGAGILLAPARAEGAVAQLFDKNNAGPFRQTIEGQCR